MIAWVCLSFIVLNRFWAVWFFTSSPSITIRWGSPPHRIWLGDDPVVVFFQLLCTAVAIESQLVQSSGAAEVTMRRYCLIHWFFHSNNPSVWGWKAIKIFCWAPIWVAKALPKWEVNRGSLSVMTSVAMARFFYFIKTVITSEIKYVKSWK